MKLFKTLLQQTKGYRLLSILCPLLIIIEVYMETQIPFVMSDMVDKGILGGAGTEYVLLEGGKMVLMALASLIAGAGAARVAAKAGMGFGSNLRNSIFAKIQDFSFENIDKFSSSSLVTRLTTDIAHVQMSYLMVIRTALRSPLMFLFSVIMAYIMGGPLSSVFIFVIPFLAGGLFLVSKFAMPAFHSVFKKYDKLNESIEENVRAVRVVKGFSRQEHETEKFTAHGPVPASGLC